MSPEDPFGDVQSLIAELDEKYRSGRPLKFESEGPEEYIPDIRDRRQKEASFMTLYFWNEVRGRPFDIGRQALNFRNNYNLWKETIAKSTDDDLKRKTARTTLATLLETARWSYENALRESRHFALESDRARQARDAMDMWGKMVDIDRAALEIKAQ